MIHRFKDIAPTIHENAFVADTSDIIGKVTIAEDVSLWFGSVIRGDVNSIVIEKGTNIQDNVVIHVNSIDKTHIGEYVSIGHGSIVHGCTIGNNTLIGMGSIILDGAEIGEYTIVGAGSLVTQGKKIPSGVLCVGSPAKVIRELTEEEKKTIIENAEGYIKVSKEYLENK